MNRRSLLFTASAATLSACAPLTQQLDLGPLGFRGPRFEGEDFVSFDGARLGLKTWMPRDGEPEWVIVGLHGMNDYSNSFHMAADWWAGQGIATYAFDVRGFGRSPERGVWAPVGVVLEDIRACVALVGERHPRSKVALAGISMGGGLAIVAMTDPDPPKVDRLLLFAPAVWGWSEQPLPNRASLWITSHMVGGWVVEPPEWLVRSVMPSDNLDELRRMGRDPIMIWGARSDTIYGLVGLMEKAWRATDRIPVPTGYFYGANDHIIPKAATVEAAARLKPGDRTACYAQGWHLLLVDRQAPVVWRDAESFLRDPAAPWPSGVPAIPRDVKALEAMVPKLRKTASGL